MSQPLLLASNNGWNGRTEGLLRRGPPDQAEMIGGSSVMRAVRAKIAAATRTDSTVLITGETGTGKYLAAELIHLGSSRKARPLSVINCAALPDALLESELFGHERGAFTGAVSGYPGKLKLAEGGTVLLDEIGDMSDLSQAKVLNALESRSVVRLGGRMIVPLDIRIISATNRRLEQMVQAGRFRRDLFYRLNVFRITIPALREHNEDMADLVHHFILSLNRQFGQAVEGLSKEALECLQGYDWPGNVRELRNLLETLFVNGPSRRISRLEVEEQLWQATHAEAGLASDERERLLSALRSTNWNKSQACRKLHCSRMTLYRKLKKHQIAPEVARVEAERRATLCISLL
ncbi:MAG: sigma-54-dependent Fis family transcriptional regulator [Acidobacteria bacterium]|nr:MAG: sigma-54-dependent Fis family transcriptional regulator [Acidobacteriota bacterium]